MKITSNLKDSIETLQLYLPLGKSFDFESREFTIDGTPAYLAGLNGLYDNDMLQKVLADLASDSETAGTASIDLHKALQSKIGYVQVTSCNDFSDLTEGLLSGLCALLAEGSTEGILLDLRSYPSRGIEEPDMERITRGSRDGFVENLVTNVSLIRRRIRSPKLIFSMHHTGQESKTDIAVAYLEGAVNQELLVHLEELIDNLKITSVTMGSQSIEELLVRKRWWNPLPNFRMTERPDVACSYLYEGYILLLVDNSPMSIILPCTIFQFTQSPDDYYKSPLIGTYFRLLRFLCIPVTLYLMPVFLLITAFFPDFTDKWNLLSSGSMAPPRIIFYVFAVEIGMDLFKYSTSLSSSRFSGSLSIVGGLLIGDMAVQLNWASMEVLFYAAVTLLAGLSLSSPEFADACRIYRLFLLITTAIGGLPGFLIGFLLVNLSILTTPTLSGMSYFWPLFPFNKKAMGNLLFRKPTAKAQPTKVWRR